MSLIEVVVMVTDSWAAARALRCACQTTYEESIYSGHATVGIEDKDTRHEWKVGWAFFFYMGIRPLRRHQMIRHACVYEAQSALLICVKSADHCCLTVISQQRTLSATYAA